MDSKAHTAALAELHSLRDDIKNKQAEAAKLEAQRARRISALAGYEKAKADRGLQAAPPAALRLSVPATPGLPSRGFSRLLPPPAAASDLSGPSPACPCRLPAVLFRCVVLVAQFLSLFRHPFLYR
ncbi:hypothetical protein [Streptomyces chattanoogensis]|uniref:hypothetical protein n=1 Tax=Streptomyces chattanoogensis TaxID=66876 RepID=UPI003697BAD3